VIDGKLDDACWKTAGVAAPFYKCDDNIPADIPADVPTEVLLCRDAENLYVAWKATGANAREAVRKMKPGDTPAYSWRDEQIVTIVQPISIPDNWFGFYMNPTAACASRSQRDGANYRADFRSAAQATDDGATIELAIPFRNPSLHVPKEGEWWRLEFGRVANDEWTAWSNTRGAHETPGRYGYVFFGTSDAFRKTTPPVPPQVEFYGESYWYRADEPTTQFVASLRGIPFAERQMRLELFRVGGERVSLDRLAVGDLKQPKVAFLCDLRGLGGGQYEMEAALADKAGQAREAGKWSFSIKPETEKAIPFPTEGVEIVAWPQDKQMNAVWPITTGVPLPRGAVHDTKELGLFENGRRIPVQIVPRATWFCSSLDGGAGVDNGGLRWVCLTFIGRYDIATPRRYVLKKLPAGAPPAPASPLTVTEEATRLVIKTGPAQLVISKESFDGVNGAWLDSNANGQFEPGEQLIGSGGGPYVVDAAGKRYEARRASGKADAVSVAIEEQGPVRVVVAAKGWHHTDKGEPLCIYHTRVIAYAGLPFFRVLHRTLVTFDTRKNKLADVGFSIPSRAVLGAAFGADNAAQHAYPRKGGAWSSSLHQDRHDHFRMIYEDGDPKNPDAPPVQTIGVEGRRSDGTVRAILANDGRGFQVTLKDVWQKFPKELEVNQTGIVLHFWPRHGEDTFSDQEELSRDNIHKLHWAHEGKCLDLQIPAKYETRLKDICRTDWFALDEGVRLGVGSNGQGVAIANEFIVHLDDRTTLGAAPSPGLIQQDPHAVADPAFACATNAFEKIRHQDMGNFGPLERLLEKGYLAYTGFFRNTNEWGMWNYADLHTYPKPYFGYPNLHRVWLASHYRNVSTAWMMYFRSGSPGWLAWARAYGDHYMNVDTCNYADPKDAIVGEFPPGRKCGAVIRKAGAMMHCKGFAHWTSDLNAAAHFTDPEAFLWQYYMTGDYAARDTYELWAAAMDDIPMPYAANREGNNVIASLLARYRHVQNPQWLLYIHRMGDALVGVPLANHGSSNIWDAYWLERYYALTRDERIVKRTQEYLVSGTNSARNSLTYASFSAVCFDRSGDKSYVADALPNAWATTQAIYLNRDDAYDGWPAMEPNAGGSVAYAAAPRWMRAMTDAGLKFELTKPTCGVPLGAAFVGPDKTPAVMDLLFLEPDDRDFSIRLEFRSDHPLSLRVFDSTNQQLAAKSNLSGIFYGDKAVTIDVPKDGKRGLARMTAYVHEFVTPFRLPVSTLPAEAAVLHGGGPCRLYGLVQYVSPEPGFAGEVTLEFGAPGNYFDYRPSAIEVTSVKGETLLDSSVGSGFKRMTVTVTIDTRKNSPPWRVCVAHRMALRFLGPERLYLSADAERLGAILEAVGKK
jgi:hypothetical protein